MRFIFTLISAALLTGCVSLSLGPVGNVDESVIRVKDSRTASEKKSYREDVLSPTIFLGDDDFDKSPLIYLKDALFRNKPADMKSVDLELQKFRIVDNFPNRLSKATSAALYGALTSLGYEHYESRIKNVDSIICIIEGNMNGKQVKSVSTVPYKISDFAGAVRSQPQFIAAVKESLNQCVNNAYQQAK